MKLTKEKYYNIINMLNSDDKENKIIGLSIINELNIESNIIKLLLIKKHSIKINDKLYEEHAPAFIDYLDKLKTDGILDNSKTLTYKTIMSTAKQLNVDKEGFKFLLDDFSEYLKNQCLAMGYDFIEDIQIKTTFKEYEQSRELSQSI